MADVSFFGKRLRKRREALGLTQVRLAEVSGVNLSTINRLETGKTQKVTNEVERRLAEALQTNVLWLHGEDSVDEGWARVIELARSNGISPAMVEAVVRTLALAGIGRK